MTLTIYVYGERERVAIAPPRSESELIYGKELMLKSDYILTTLGPHFDYHSFYLQLRGIHGRLQAHKILAVAVQS